MGKEKVRKMFILITVGFLLLTLGIHARADEPHYEPETILITEIDNEHMIMPFGAECPGGSLGGSGSTLNGWMTISGHRYFFVNGVRRTGWFQEGAAWFFFNPPAGTSGHSGSIPVGRMRTGWLQRGSAWYFLNPTAGTSGHNSNHVVGRMQTGWLQRGNAWYFLNPAAGSAGHNPNRAHGRMLTGWLHRNGNYYFLNPAAGVAGHNPSQAYGRMQTGLLQRGSNRFFLHTTSGRMQTGWVNRSGHYYFFNPVSGVAGHDRTHSHGAMLTGWLQRNSNMYFLNLTSGRMQRGWLAHNGNSYFFNNSGRMQTGWVNTDGHRFFMNSAGRMQRGWIQTGGHHYYLHTASGRLQTGWFTTGGQQFFSNPLSGHPAHRSELPGGARRTGRVATTGIRDRSGDPHSVGEVHDFNSNGVWLGQVNDPGRHMNLWWPRRASGATRISLPVFRFSNDWHDPMMRGIDNWNNSAANIVFYTDGNSPNRVHAIPAEWSELGILNWTRSLSLTNETTMTRFELTMNTRTISNHVNNNIGFTLDNVIESVMTHELGHVISLQDNPAGVSDNGSIMNHRRIRNTITRPTNFDVQSVNMIYN